MELKRKDGSILPAELSFSPEMKSDEGSERTIIIRDVTERRQAEEAVRSAALFPIQNPEPVLRIHRDGTLLFSNPAAGPVLAEWRTASGNQFPDWVRQTVEAALNEGAPRDLEIRIAGRDFSFVVTPIVEGQYANLYGWDVTDRKRAEAALQESEERYRGLFESMNEGFALHELLYDESGEPCDYRFLDVNPAFERLTGLKRQDVVGKTVVRSPAGHGAGLDQAIWRGRSHRHACPFREPLLGTRQGLRGLRVPAGAGTVCGDFHGHYRAQTSRRSHQEERGKAPPGP